ncbi:ABC transporter substrate-binding protein [Paenarthrobacter sp. NPDC092416]|uniref:ABC transporter substrate-binding protein n=1 Tax=Paenarthrobacter sp. NPDC092416 TaxID=3364386 RepID=UPI00380EAB1C
MSSSFGHRLRTSVLLSTAALMAFSMVSCTVPTGESNESGSTQGNITLGLLAPLTGVAAADGKLMEQGAQLAVDEINAKGGIDGRKVELKALDVRDQKSDAVSAAVTQLTSNPDVAAVLTGYASTTNFEIDQLAEAGIPYLLSGNSAQTGDIISKNPEKYPGVWSLAPSYEGYSTGVPEQLEAWNADGTFPLRNRKAYIISSDNAYSNGIASGLEKNLKAKGWEVTGPDTVPFGEVDDWTTQITKIRQVDPAVIINLDYLTANASKFLTQFRQNPTQSLVFSQYAPSVPEFTELAGRNADGVLYNLPFAPLPALPETKELTKKLTDKYQAEPSLYSFGLYEQVYLWADAVRAVGDPGKRSEVGVALGKLDTQTTLGRVHFDPATHLAVAGKDGIPMTYYQIQNGKRLNIAPEEFADGKFQRPEWMK